MKCILCGKRKGKRHCPAKNAMICAQCCGEKRVVEIHCELDCQYLKSGKNYRRNKLYDSMARHWPEKFLRFAGMHDEFPGGVLIFEDAIVLFARELSSLTDDMVLKGVRLALEDLRSESKGIIYEHSSPDPLAQALSRKLAERIEVLRKGVPELGLDRLRTADLISCLECLELQVRHFIENEPNDTFLRFAKRSHPAAALEGDAEEAPSLIVKP